MRPGNFRDEQYNLLADWLRKYLDVDKIYSIIQNMIDGHGDDLYRYSGKIHINFSTNIPQNVCRDRLLEHLHECGAVFRNYRAGT